MGKPKLETYPCTHILMWTLLEKTLILLNKVAFSNHFVCLKSDLCGDLLQPASLLAINIFPVPAFPVLAFILQFHKNPCDGQMLFSFVTHSECSVTRGRKASFGSVWLRNPVEQPPHSKDFHPGLFSLGFSLVTVAELIQGDSEPFGFNCSGSAGQTGRAGQWGAFRA